MRPFIVIGVGLMLAVFAAVMPAYGNAVPGIGESRALPSGTDEQIRFFERKVAQRPDEPGLRNQLARAYVQKHRENGDPGYLIRAEGVLTKTLEAAPRDDDAIALYAWVLLFKHDFQGAVAWASKMTSRHRSDNWSYGILSDAYLELGDYKKAVTYTQKMIDVRPDQGGYSRAAHLRSLHGDPVGALDLWGLAIRASAPRGEGTAWCQTELAQEYFNQGRLDEAEKHFGAALGAFPHYHRASAGLARVREAQARWGEAAQLYHQAIEVYPALQYVGALGDVYARLGQPEKAEQQFKLVEQIANLDRLNQVLLNRELAQFYADHQRNLEEAVRLARREVEVRRDIHTYDVLAWALYQSGRVTEAQAAIQQALRLGTQDARLHFHAGMIAQALSQKREAKAALSRALAINPHFHPAHAALARRALKEVG